MYTIIKLYIRTALHLYFKKIKVHGLKNLPKDKPILFLPNHQNALLDVLLIATNCQRKPWFLARSDIFKKKFFTKLFTTVQMLPIYRIRDGRETLQKNQAVFERCAELLIKKKAIVLFPEANHNLQRRVRPLSKGFIKIISTTLDKAQNTDIAIVPVGMNYSDAVRFPDSAALYFGAPILVRTMYEPSSKKTSLDEIKATISNQLKTLTTHIDNEDTYTETIQALDALGVNYLDPKSLNANLQNMPTASGLGEVKKNKNFLGDFLKLLFTILNFPVLLIWRSLMKPKVPELEFLATYRFAFALIAYPIYYGMIVLISTLFVNIEVGILVALGLFVFNWFYVKSSFTQ